MQDRKRLRDLQADYTGAYVALPACTETPRVRARGSQPPMRGAVDLRAEAAAVVAQLRAREHATMSARAQQVAQATAKLRAHEQTALTQKIRVRTASSTLLTAAWFAALLTWVAVTAICLLA